MAANGRRDFRLSSKGRTRCLIKGSKMVSTCPDYQESLLIFILLANNLDQAG